LPTQVSVRWRGGVARCSVVAADAVPCEKVASTEIDVIRNVYAKGGTSFVALGEAPGASTSASPSTTVTIPRRTA